jgi:hypothetical protein
MWRNGRRNGLKIAVLAISVPLRRLSNLAQFAWVKRAICGFALHVRGQAEMASLLHKFLHTGLIFGAREVRLLLYRGQKIFGQKLHGSRREVFDNASFRLD